MYKINLDRISKLEKKYKNSALSTNLLYRLIDTLLDGLDLTKMTEKSFNIKMLIDLKIIEEEKQDKKK